MGIKIAVFLRCKALEKVCLIFSRAGMQNLKCGEKVRLFTLFRSLPLRTILCTGKKLRPITLLTVIDTVQTQLVISASACLGINEKFPFVSFGIVYSPPYKQIKSAL